MQPNDRTVFLGSLTFNHKLDRYLAITGTYTVLIPHFVPHSHVHANASIHAVAILKFSAIAIAFSAGICPLLSPHEVTDMPAYWEKAYFSASIIQFEHVCDSKKRRNLRESMAWIWKSPRHDAAPIVCMPAGLHLEP